MCLNLLIYKKDYVWMRVVEIIYQLLSVILLLIIQDFFIGFLLNSHKSEVFSIQLYPIYCAIIFTKVLQLWSLYINVHSKTHDLLKNKISQLVETHPKAVE